MSRAYKWNFWGFEPGKGQTLTVPRQKYFRSFAKNFSWRKQRKGELVWRHQQRGGPGGIPPGMECSPSTKMAVVFRVNPFLRSITLLIMMGTMASNIKLVY